MFLKLFVSFLVIFSLANTQCGSSCQNCTNNFCFECSSGYYPAEGGCQPCSPPCIDCISDQLCLSCSSEDYMISGACKPCGADCSSCSHYLGCIFCLSGEYAYQGACVRTCPSGTYPSNGECVGCPTSCQTCTSASSCTSCGTTFQLVAGKCITCPAGCTSCIALLCTGCLPGLVKKNGACQSIQCQSGTYYNPTSQVCTNCVQNCQNCDSSSDCNQCNSGYFWNGTVCLAITTKPSPSDINVTEIEGLLGCP